MNQMIRETVLSSGKRLQIVQGDITIEVVDAIVNAANRYLQHGGGVAGAIIRMGGPQIQAESDAWVAQRGPVSNEEPAYTSAGKLPCRYVIHAVGPIWGEGQEDEKLTAAVAGSLELASRLDLVSLALPAISTGIFGFPKDRAADLIIRTVYSFLEQRPQSSLEQVRLTLYDQPTLGAFLDAWQKITGV
jgi:O-acetyl-ADP-ribose deacetylase (regulator of RNase III)